MTDTRPVRLGSVALGIAAAWAVVWAYSLHAALPLNPLRLPHGEKVSAHAWMPQGWGFFTRDPREPRMVALVRHADRWHSASRRPISRADNVFGLDRGARAQGVEMGLLLQGLPAAAWTECAGTPEICLDGAKPAARIRNRSPRASMCGALGFVQQEPVPWAWARPGETIHMPSRVARAEVAC